MHSVMSWKESCWAFASALLSFAEIIHIHIHSPAYLCMSHTVYCSRLLGNAVSTVACDGCTACEKANVKAVSTCIME